jgi:hypothetical protein
MKSSVVLINPPFSLRERYGEDMKKFGAVSEPLGIAYIAAYLESQGITVQIIDAQAKNLSVDDVVGTSEGEFTMADIAINRDQLDNVKGICL